MHKKRVDARSVRRRQFLKSRLRSDGCMAYHAQNADRATSATNQVAPCVGPVWRIREFLNRRSRRDGCTLSHAQNADRTTSAMSRIVRCASAVIWISGRRTIRRRCRVTACHLPLVGRTQQKILEVGLLYCGGTTYESELRRSELRTRQVAPPGP